MENTPEVKPVTTRELINKLQGMPPALNLPHTGELNPKVKDKEEEPQDTHGDQAALLVAANEDRDAQTPGKGTGEVGVGPTGPHLDPLNHVAGQQLTTLGWLHHMGEVGMVSPMYYGPINTAGMAETYMSAPAGRPARGDTDGRERDGEDGSAAGGEEGGGF